ncbi:ornithine--oxo-acid transaminase [Georgenia satyanarayanai]|uniref:ornithine aminotransferase n=1 Tax=Georgenia satyanarayanai TaxID=860221 RepID=A0A2Y9C7Q9_9MICO|nr:ornithine--oxo-acid transaminase [Georgenia satyanarayanai]PYF96712.1 ornithine--oxo-acid transaminase [Georgenia satyanarayanai]SSA46453.1 ornithine--oxo-acid transaminase [Georgenia satyanarayanai]
MTTAETIAVESAVLAQTYAPLPVVLTEGQGVWVRDVEGREYLDALAGYSALNFGHAHPALVAAAEQQLRRLTLTSRAFHNDRLAGFAQRLSRLCGKDRVLPMNTGAEAVETAIKVARKWAYTRRGVPDGRARIIVAENNFHGRTTTIVGFSSDPAARAGFGPYDGGFDAVPFGDAAALEAAVQPTTTAVLLEPIQGEAGVVLPPPGYLAAVREICDRHGLLLLADEVQSGLGRTGRTFACENDAVVPDVYILGKALGGGVLPVSAVVADTVVLDVLGVGEHGSTFGGNPLACAVGEAVIGLLEPGDLQEHVRALEPVMEEGLARLHELGVLRHRVRGLWAGIDLDPRVASGRRLCEELQHHGVLTKDTHGATLRLAPPLVITDEELMLLLERLESALLALQR